MYGNGNTERSITVSKIFPVDMDVLGIGTSSHLFSAAAFTRYDILLNTVAREHCTMAAGQISLMFQMSVLSCISGGSW